MCSLHESAGGARQTWSAPTAAVVPTHMHTTSPDRHTCVSLWLCAPTTTHAPPMQNVDEDEILIRFALACRRNGQRSGLNGVKKPRAGSVKPRGR